MTLAYAAQLGLKVRKTDINAQKIDGFLLETYGVVIAAFQVFYKLSCSCFFQKTFLLTERSIKVVFGMLWLTFGNADI